MKYLLLIFTLLVSTLMFSSPSFAEWTKVDEGAEEGRNKGISYYVDFEKIREEDGYIYFWLMSNFSKPTIFGHLSDKLYKQGDCKLFRYKSLTYYAYKQPMVRGSGEKYDGDRKWKNPTPNAVDEEVLKQVCSKFIKASKSKNKDKKNIAGWTEVIKSVDGDTFYVDFERMRKHGGYVYWWDLTDYPKPTKHGTLSSKVYTQGDCKLFRYKYLSYSFHKEPMGGGTGDVQEPVKKHQGWKYPPPNSVYENILKSVCSR
jgi:hypothetical protein